MSIACRQSPKYLRAAGKQRRISAGFSLVELMVTIAIAGILLAIAVPSFNSLIASQQAKAVASELYVSLSRARSEAVLRNANITLSAKSGGWQNGWQILDPANAVLDDRGAAGSATISGPTSVIYQGSGRVQGSSKLSFVITVMSGSTAIYQCVSVELSGRPYTKAGSSC